MRRKRNIFAGVLVMTMVCCGSIVAFAGAQSTTWYKNGKAYLSGSLSTVAGELLASDEAKATSSYAGSAAANVKVKVDLIKDGSVSKTSGWITKEVTANTGWVTKVGMDSAKGYYNCDDGPGYWSSNKTLSSSF